MARKISNFSATDSSCSEFCTHQSDLLNLRNLPGYKISLRLTKRVDQELISISTILKFLTPWFDDFHINVNVIKLENLLLLSYPQKKLDKKPFAFDKKNPMKQ